MGSDEVVRNDGASRFELVHDGQLAGVLKFKLDGDQLALTHTEVSPDFGGRGFGAQLVSSALADAQARGESVLPVCPYVRAYLGKHPQWQSLVPVQYRADYGLA